MSVCDIESHLQRLYGTTALGRDTIGRVTDAVLADVAAWRAWPLERVYPIVYLDALMVKVREDRSVRSRACYLAIGVSVEGEREVLGLWWQESEGAKIRKSIKTRGHFPDEQAATKLIYLAILRAEGKWRQAYNWTAALRSLKIHFGDRQPD